MPTNKNLTNRERYDRDAKIRKELTPEPSAEVQAELEKLCEARDLMQGDVVKLVERHATLSTELETMQAAYDALKEKVIDLESTEKEEIIPINVDDMTSTTAA